MIIYKITNLINNKIYIGLTIRGLDCRWKAHLQSVKQGSQFAIHRAIRKYGKDSFKVEELDTATNLDELLSLESKYILELDSMNPKLGYNMMYQNDSIKHFTEEVRKKLSKSQKQRMLNLTPERKKEIYRKSASSRQGEKRTNNRKYAGVQKSSQSDSFVCQITYNYKVYTRTFPTEIEAAIAYDKMALYLYGEKAKLNIEGSREAYLKEDLDLYVDYFLNSRTNIGRKPTNSYTYNILTDEAKINAKNILEDYIKTEGITEEDTSSLLRMKFMYNGTPEFIFRKSEK